MFQEKLKKIKRKYDKKDFEILKKLCFSTIMFLNHRSLKKVLDVNIMKKILLSLILVSSFSLVVLGDIPPRPKDGQSEQKEKGTCMSVMLLTAGIFLLGRWLIKRDQSQIKEVN